MANSSHLGLSFWGFFYCYHIAGQVSQCIFYLGETVAWVKLEAKATGSH